MFYDERIENAKGRISKRALLISLIVTLLSGGIYCANIFINAPFRIYYWFASVCVAIVLGSFTIIILGLILGKLGEHDERTIVQQNIYYKRAASILLKLVLCVYAGLLPLEYYLDTPFGFICPKIDTTLSPLLFIVVVYVVYSFRKEDICFNYSIIDSDHYYKGVWKNIGKLALSILFLLGISLLSLSAITIKNALKTNECAQITWDIAIYYIVTLIACSVVYLLYSSLERASYRSETFFSTSTVISLGITVLIYVAYRAVNTILLDYLPKDLTLIVKLAPVTSSLIIYARYAFVIFLTYFGYEYQKKQKNKLVIFSCSTVLLGETLLTLMRHVSAGLGLLIFNVNRNAADYTLFSSIHTYVYSSLLSITCVIGFVLIIFALVKDKLIHKAHLCSVVPIAVLGGIEFFLRTQENTLLMDICYVAADFIMLSYIIVLVACISKQTAKNIQ